MLITTMEKSIDELKTVFRYDPETGLISWLKPPRGFRTPNGAAGTVNKSGYVVIGRKPNFFTAHRLAWALHTGEWPQGQIDHINGIRNDNRWVNLRLATGRQNKQNSPLPAHNTSGFKNVHWDKNRNRWYAKVIDNNGKRHSSFHLKIEDAVKEAERMRALYHGDFARHE